VTFRPRRAAPKPPLRNRASHATARSSAMRAGVMLVLAAAVLAVGASAASAVILRLRNGHSISYRPLRGAFSPASPFATRKPRPLEYHGGPIMSSNNNYAVYWDPKGAPQYPAEYQEGVNKYLEDLAHDSGGPLNVDSIAIQYGDSAGELAHYNSQFASAISDTDPYPPSGCAAAAICFTDGQLQAELRSYVESHSLPHDLTHEYFLLTPPGVENCAEPTACSAGSSLPFYCAYHGFVPFAGGNIIYAVDPYVTGNPGCDDGEHPNAKPSDGVLVGGLSHEHNESVTDPEINAWYDSKGEEDGDKCRTFVDATEFGAPLGNAPDGSRYNQVVNSHLYWYQQEWSNEGLRCEQRREPLPPTVTRLSPKRGHAAGGTTVLITGQAFTGATSVRFGAAKATEFKLLSGSTIQAVSPPGVKGPVDVSVTTPNGTNAPTRKDHFKYTR
jgi:hypothetical protein